MKPTKDSKVKDSQMKMKTIHDKSTKMPTLEKGEKDAVKSTIQGGNGRGDQALGTRILY